MKRGAIGGSWALGLTLVCFALPAHAAKHGQAFRLEYWADGACPDAAEFARQIQTRAPGLRLAEGAEPALGFYAELAEHGGDATGRLTARSPDGREMVREVRGPTCTDVVTALALIAALAADPNQPWDDKAPPAPRPTKHVLRHVPDEPAPEFLAPPPDPKERWTFGIGAGVGFESAIAPNPGYGFSVSLDAEGYPGSAWRPLLSLSAIRAITSSPQISDGATTTFDWFTFRFALCPARWPEETPLFIRPCAFFDGGFLGGEVDGKSETKTWTAIGTFLRTEASFAEVLSFQLDGGLTVPLNRSSFSGVFTPPATGLLGRIGLSYRFQ
ncbi:MAG TPA: hypothetical protein VER96_18295 [Polyangiaceae bacterium]|nr:hypothetical protein [Polyangiaceae bacterium]